MRLTPLDIRKQEFKRGMRGLDSDEVYAFLATVADEYEAALNDNKALRERLLELDDKVQEYRNMEKTLRDTLLTAERLTVDAKDNARREAELIIKQAELDADKGVRDIKTSATQLRQEIRSLKSQRDSYLTRMKMLVESHLKLIEAAERDLDEEDKWFAVDTSKTAPTTDTEKTATSTASARPLPADADIKAMPPALDATTDPEEPPTKGMTTEETPLPTAAPDTREDVRAEAPPVSEATIERSAADRLNDLLDRVVQQTAMTATDAATTATDVATETENVTETATEMATEEPLAGDTSGATGAGIDTAFGGEMAAGGEVAAGEIEGSEEWSLDQLKSDILNRRHGKDETTG